MLIAQIWVKHYPKNPSTNISPRWTLTIQNYSLFSAAESSEVYFREKLHLICRAGFELTYERRGILEAITRRCSVRRCSWKFWKTHRKKSCFEVSFLIELQALRPVTLLKKRFRNRCFPVNFAKTIPPVTTSGFLRLCWLEKVKPFKMTNNVRELS